MMTERTKCFTFWDFITKGDLYLYTMLVKINLKNPYDKKTVLNARSPLILPATCLENREIVKSSMLVIKVMPEIRVTK